MSTNDPLDQALRQAAPLGSTSLDTPQVHDLIGALLADVRADSELADVLPFADAPARRRRRTVLKSVIATTVVLAAGTGAAAAGGFLDLHTGVFGAPGMTENDTSEFLNGDSPEAGDLMRSYTAETPLAPGYDIDPLIERFTTANGHFLVQADGLKGAVFAWSYCSWELSWLDAHAAGNSVDQQAATAVLSEIPDWPIVARIDGDGGLTASVQRTAQAASEGDPSPIQRDADINCDQTFDR